MPTPKELAQQASEVKALARPFRALLALADTIESLGPIEQVISEANARRDVAVKEAEEAQANAKDAQGKHASVKAKVVAAETEAADTIAKAKDAAAKITASATDEAKGIVAAANAKVAVLDDELAAKRAQLQLVKQEHTDASAALEATQAAHEQMKKKFAALAR